VRSCGVRWAGRGRSPDGNLESEVKSALSGKPPVPDSTAARGFRCVPIPKPYSLPTATVWAVPVVVGVKYRCDVLGGLDVVRADSVIGTDLSEREILETVGDAECRLILTPVGGQGFLLGRGNQQISPEVLRQVGKENIVVVATAEKLSALRGRPLLVDTGDPDTDEWLSGYYRVVTGYREVTVYRVSSTWVD